MMDAHSEGELLTKNSMLDDGFWDIQDLSNYLKVKIKTLYAMIPFIPHYRVGKLIRFRKKEIDLWMEKKRAGILNEIQKSAKITRKKPDKGNINLDKLIRKVIDQSRKEAYNPDHGKSDRIEGPKKER